MNILGIHYGHNATVCLMQDGHITFCQSEERFNRIKNSVGFPYQTLAHVYDRLVPPEKIDAAVLFQKSVYGYLFLKRHGFRSFHYSQCLDPELNAQGLKARLMKSEWGWRRQERKIARREANAELAAEATQYFAGALRLPAEKLHYLDHHDAHAWSTMPGIQSWDRTLIFTLDAVGDWKCATVRLHEGGRMQVLSQSHHHDSLGYYYSTTTLLMGMKPSEHEFKVMGLAPYAREKYYEKPLAKLRSMIWVDDDGQWQSRVNPAGLQDALERVYRYQRFDNVAGAIQQLTEELILKWVHHWVRKTGCRNVAVAGGVFMNVKACQLLLEAGEIERLFVTPSSADESTSIGCAAWGTRKLAPQLPIAPLRDLYLGVEYGDAEIEQALAEMKATERYSIATHDDINTEVGRLLAEDQIVARCSGRMEFGARALGNRSILANPSNFQNLHTINEAIKSRDFWMPFAPSILEEDMPRYVADHERIFAPYMCITFDGTAEARRDLVAAIHPRDHTLRPQCVRRDWNADYHRIISEFKRRTGIGGVLNTSFNLHGEPNVCSPQDAIRTVDASGLKHLAMGRFLLTKRVQSQVQPQRTGRPMAVSAVATEAAA